MTLYDILGIWKYATQDEIRAAYRALVKQYHPDLLRQASLDVQKLAEERLKAINEAYATLSNPRQRRLYHNVMGSIRDPARKYKGLFQPAHPRPATQERQNRSKVDETVAITLLKIKALQAEWESLRQRQALKRRRFWMSTGFSALVVFFVMWMENIAMSSSSYSLMTRVGVFLSTFISCELIAIPILINASGMRIRRLPYLGNPVVFSLMVFVGSSMSILTIFGPRQSTSMSQISFVAGGIVLSLSMLVHTIFANYLAKIQEGIFLEEQQAIVKQLRKLEQKLDDLRQKGKQR